MNSRIKKMLTYVLLSCLLVPLALSLVDSYMNEILKVKKERGARQAKQDLQILSYYNPYSKESSFEGDICSDPQLQKNQYYTELMDSYLNIWYKFIPHQSKMDSSNCWYVNDSNVLPQNLTNRMREFENFKFLKMNFSEMDTTSILSKVGSMSDSAYPTSHYFCLPITYLIGFPKTGSTYFYFHYLASHPLLAEPYTKEGLFWREMMTINAPKYRELAVLLYLYHFFNASNQIKENPDMFTIDASVSTVFATSKPLRQPEIDVCIVPLLLYKALPKMKLMAIMRDPTERLWSDFLFFCPPRKWDEIEIPKGLARTPFVVASVFHNQTVVALQEFAACTESGKSLIHCTALAGSYDGHLVACEKVRIGMSIYYAHLIKWFSVFPREQFYMMRQEDLMSDPSNAMDKVWEFLGKPHKNKFILPTETEVYGNEWSAMDDGVNFKMFPETRKLLKDFYQPYNARLAELLHDKRFMWTDNEK